MHFQGSSDWLRRVCIALVALVFASPAIAEKGKLRERLTPAVMAVVYPGAERLGVEEGSPPAIAVYKGDKIVAYVFSTLDIIAAPGYSSTPFDVIAGVDLSGRITGAKVVFHNEPHHRRRRRTPARARYLSCPRGRQTATRRHRPAAARLRRRRDRQCARHARPRFSPPPAMVLRARASADCGDAFRPSMSTASK